MSASLRSYWSVFMSGLGRIAPPDPGNTANAPADPPVPAGTYQYMQPFAYLGIDGRITDIPHISPAYQNNGEFAVAFGDAGGFLGGGANSIGNQTNIPTETAMYFDPSTGLYYNLRG